MPTNPYADSIIALYRDAGRSQGDARRRAGEVSGQMWGNLGQTAAITAGAIMKDRQEAPIRKQEADIRALNLKVGEGQLAAQGRAVADQTAMDTAMGAGGMDPDAIEASLPGHLRTQFRQSWNAAEKAKTELHAAKTTAAEKEADYLGALASGVKPYLSGPDGGVGAAQLALQHAKASGFDTTAIEQQLQADPAHLSTLIEGLIQRSPTQRKMLGEEADRTLRQQQEQRAIQTAQQTAADRDADNKRQDATAAETARHNRAVESRPPAGTLPSVPGNFDVTGDEFVKTIPAPWRQTVKKIANYEEDPTKVASMRGGNREQLMMWVNQVNPAYDSSMFANRNPTRKAFTTGTQGQQINAINTALGHISQITTLADQLQNGGFTPANKAFNAISTMFGSDKVTNFDTLKDALAGEVASVLAKGGATVSGIAEAKDKINASNSPTQLAGYVKTLIPVMGSKLAELNFQYHQAMGENDPFSALSPDSRRTLTSLGFNPDKPEVGQQQNAPQQAREGATQPIPGIPNSEATFKNGKWVRTK